MTPSETPKVTVVVPVRNRAGYVRAALESVLGQTLRDLELLVIDDASSDATREVVRGLDDPRIRLVENPSHLGIPATRNRGVDLARGEYLAFLDSDDRAVPERLEKQVRFLDTHLDHAAVGAWIEWMDPSGALTGRVKRKATRAERIAAECLFRSCLENSAATARTAVLRKFRHREHFELGSDYDLWSRIAFEHKLASLPEVLVLRRAHGGRTTRGQEERIKEMRLEIFAEQLSALGVSFSAQDLDRHYLLRRMHKVGLRPDAEYLDWAEAWLGGLEAANAKVARYPEPAFRHVLGGFWLKACWFGSRRSGPRVGGRFWGSPLRRDAWPDLGRAIRKRLPLLPASARE